MAEKSHMESADSTDKAAERLALKIEKLIHLHQLLVTENSVLRAELSRAQKALEEQRQPQPELTGKTGRNQGSVNVSEEKISELIRDIDRCIAMLGG